MTDLAGLDDVRVGDLLYASWYCPDRHDVVRLVLVTHVELNRHGLGDHLLYKFTGLWFQDMLEHVYHYSSLSDYRLVCRAPI